MQEGATRAVRWRLSGHVQGVGMRAHVHDLAVMLGIVGFVRNLPDGRIELQARGPAEPMDSFLDGVKDGSRGARVEGIQESAPRDLDGVTEFEVRS